MKNVRLEIRLTNYDSQQLEEAIRRGMSKSELIRSLIAREKERHLLGWTEVQEQVDFVPLG